MFRSQLLSTARKIDWFAAEAKIFANQPQKLIRDAALELRYRKLTGSRGN
jgi:hypothetical protein